MQFLKTLFWVLIAVVVTMFCWVNGITIPIKLWNDLEADIKLPLLLLIVFLIGFLPTWLTMRARIWTLRRRIEAMERNRLASMPAQNAPADEGEPVI
jgi:hypothetical protein